MKEKNRSDIKNEAFLFSQTRMNTEHQDITLHAGIYTLPVFLKCLETTHLYLSPRLTMFYTTTVHIKINICQYEQI